MMLMPVWRSSPDRHFQEFFNPVFQEYQMSKTIYQRLADYYAQVATVLRGEAKASSVFPNTTDVGLSREGIIAHLLRSHLPSKCNVFLGGFVFDESGNESM